MKINLENYESWFLDYAEGNLTEEQVLLLNDFLDANPSLKYELKEFEMIVLDDFKVSFPDKESLKKRENSIFGADDFIAFHEGDLTTTEEREVLDFVSKDATAKKEFDSFAKVYLRPDETIIFDHKDSLLKKDTKIIAFYWRQIAVAASILFVLGILFFTNEPVNPGLVEDPKPTDTIKDGNEIKRQIPLELERTIENELATQKIESIKEEDVVNDDEISSSENNVATVTPQKSPKKVNVPSPQLPIEHSPKIEQPEFAEEPGIEEIAPVEAVQLEIVEEEKSAFAEEPELKEKEPSKTDPLESVVQEEPAVVENDKIMEKKDNAKDNVLASPEEDKQPISAIAYVEREVATAIMGEKKKKLKMFDLLKKIGDKSNLYSLSESDNNRYQLKVSGAKVTGKKG